MFCPRCGKQIPDDVEFCAYCGKAVGKAPPPPGPRPIASAQASPPPLTLTSTAGWSFATMGVVLLVLGFLAVIAGVAGGYGCSVNYSCYTGGGDGAFYVLDGFGILLFMAGVLFLMTRRGS